LFVVSAKRVRRQACRRLDSAYYKRFTSSYFCLHKFV